MVLTPSLVHTCDKVRKSKKDGAKNAITKEALVHLNTSTETRKQTLGIIIVENLGPRGSKDKVIKIKSN